MNCGWSVKTKPSKPQLFKMKKIPNNDIYINTQEFNKIILAYNFAARLKQLKLVAKDDIAGFIKEDDFDETLTKISKKVTSDKARHIEVEKIQTVL